MFSGTFRAFITQLLTLYGLALTSAAYTSTILVLTPFFTFVISVSCGFEKIRWNRSDGQAKVIGLVSAVFGAAILALYVGPVILGHVDSGLHGEEYPSGLLAIPSLSLEIGSWQLGVICLFAAGFTLSITISMQVPILSRYPAPMSVSAFAYFSGAIMLFATSFLITNDRSAWVISEWSAVISIVYNGLIPAALNFTMLIWCVQKAGPVLVGAYIPLQLFSAAAMAYVFLGDSIHLGSVLGTLLIIVGLGLITWGQVKSRKLDALAIKATPPLEGFPTITSATNLEEPLLG